MTKFKNKLKQLENYKVLQGYLPNDHSNRQQLSYYIKMANDQLEGTANILDLGCGKGDSIELFEEFIPKVHWHGVDIENSPEVNSRTRISDLIKSYDGINLPYKDNYFDIIYCNQVLEHVRHPDKLITEVRRTLKPNGLFIGAVSYLEPFHSYSIFNFTPYGIIRVFEDANLKIKEIRPGSDASLLINRQLLNRSPLMRFLWNRNYLHIACNLIGSVFKLNHSEKNFLKVQFAGHLVFLAYPT